MTRYFREKDANKIKIAVTAPVTILLTLCLTGSVTIVFIQPKPIYSMKQIFFLKIRFVHQHNSYSAALGFLFL